MAYPVSDDEQATLDAMRSVLRGERRGWVRIRVDIANPATEDEFRRSHGAYLYLGAARTDSDADMFVRVSREIAHELFDSGAEYAE